jgi:hypothetical protein
MATSSKSSKKKGARKAQAKATPRKQAAARPKPKPQPKAEVKPQPKAPPVAKPAKGKPAGHAPAPAKGAPAKGAPAKGGAPAAKAPGAPATPARPKKSSRRSALLQRRGPDGQILAPGELLLPGGTQSPEEVLYLFRGAIATQKLAADGAIGEVLAKKQPTDPLAHRPDLERAHGALMQRFHQGPIEASLPNRGQPKRTFQGVIERAKQRRREIGSFLRGLDIGRPESSQMDSHGEASLQSLMEWSARLEKLADADEPAQGDYGQFHRGLDQLDHTTEALIVDVELTLRRLGGGRQK